jgi:hypothetical protein
MSKIEVDAIDKQSGSTLTLGGSGTAVTLASGATQTGFGRTGTVDWDTTPKTGDFTAANGEGYFVNTAGGQVTVTLPGSPSAGNVVAISDYNGSAGSNAITIARNGSNINGSATNLVITKNSSAIQLVYVDATNGWAGVITSNPNDISNPFISASGGNITEDGNFKIHTFTGPGTFSVTAGTCSSNNEVSYLVVGGGGAGGTGTEAASSVGSGGGGAGGFRERRAANDSYTVSPLNGATPITVTTQSFPITVGAGSVGRASTPNQCEGNNPNGSPSTFSSITSAGGGFGVSRNGTPNCLQTGGPGGSGGGASYGGPGPAGGLLGGVGNTPPVSPAQGNPGGKGSAATPSHPGGGGGGAIGVGEDALPHPAPGPAASGGSGATTHITGSPVVYAGGGGGGIGEPGGSGSGSGGSGGGGDGASYPPTGSGDGSAATANTGGGGGGSGSGGVFGACIPLKGGNGGSGVVIIRYKFQ